MASNALTMSDVERLAGSLADTFGRGSQCIEIMSFSWVASNATNLEGQGFSAGKVDFSPIKINP